MKSSLQLFAEPRGEVSESSAIIIANQYNCQDYTLVSLRVSFQNLKNVAYPSGVISEFSANYNSLPAYILVSLYSSNSSG